MSCGAESSDLHEFISDVKVEEVMKLFNVSEQTADRIISWTALQAQKRCEKWYDNLLKCVDERLKEMSKENKR